MTGTGVFRTDHFLRRVLIQISPLLARVHASVHVVVLLRLCLARPDRMMGVLPTGCSVESLQCWGERSREATEALPETGGGGGTSVHVAPPPVGGFVSAWFQAEWCRNRGENRGKHAAGRVSERRARGPSQRGAGGRAHRSRSPAHSCCSLVSCRIWRKARRRVAACSHASPGDFTGPEGGVHFPRTERTRQEDMRSAFPRFREQQIGIEDEARASHRRWDATRLRAVGSG